MARKQRSTLKKIKADLIRKGFFVRLPVKYSAIHGEVAMFRSALDRALADLFDQETQGEIISWICDDYADNEKDLEGSFGEVCELSLIPKELVYQKFVEILFMLERKDGERFRKVGFGPYFESLGIKDNE